jgi:hypothetical protein
MAVLDFVLIGAPNAGASTLSWLLSKHPQIALPAPATHSIWIDRHRYEFGPEWTEPGFFTREHPDALRGLISPGHMSGLLGIRDASWPVEHIAASMVRTLPDAKLIALLANPIERAIAHHRLASHHGLERRPLARALHEQSTPGALTAARQHPRLPTGYIAWGEYGRILTAYRHHYPRSQLLILYTTELHEDPTGTLTRIAGFLEIDDHWPTTTPEQHQHTTPEPHHLPDELLTHLTTHYATDAQQLNEMWMLAPWAGPGFEARQKRRRQQGSLPVFDDDPSTHLDGIVARVSRALELGEPFSVTRTVAPELPGRLLGVDPVTGRMSRRSPLLPLLRGRPVAIVGPALDVEWASWRNRERLRDVGLDIRFTVGINGIDDIERVVIALGAHRDLYDAVVVSGDVPAEPLCKRLARELELVAIDLGDALQRMIDPRVAPPVQREALHDVAAYLRESTAPRPKPPHALEGRLVRVHGEPAVYYIERGAARVLRHRALTQLFDHRPVEIERSALDRLPRGMPLLAVRERFGGTYLPVDGTKRPLTIELPLTILDEPPASTLRRDERTISWFPKAVAAQPKRPR